MSQNTPKNKKHKTLIPTEKEALVPRFLVIKKDEGDFLKVSPFVITKTLYGLVGEVKSMKKVKDGLLVEAKSNKQANKLLNLVRFGEYDVKVLIHSTLNRSKGIIYCPDLLNCEVKEIEQSLEEHGVLEVKRITRKKEGKTFDTPIHILTFDTPVLPKTINVAFYHLEVRPYIPNPLRCYKCQKFGHVSDKCENTEVCVCGKEPHEGTPCPLPITCLNCQGSHSARSRNCPIFKNEFAIQKIKTLERITYREAQRKFRETQTTDLPKSFSEAVGSQNNSNNSSVKNIIKELMPEIVKICKSVLKEEKTFTKPSVPSSSRSISEDRTPALTRELVESLDQEKEISKSRSRSRTTSEASSKKRERSNEGADSDESHGSHTNEDDRAKKKSKKGWPKGKPRKPPSENDDNETTVHMDEG